MKISNKVSNTNLPSEKGHSSDISSDAPLDTGTFQEDLAELDGEANTSANSPNLRGSHSVFGSEPAPESDDDVLQNAHDMGIAPNADTDTMTPLNLAKNIADAEKHRRTH